MLWLGHKVLDEGLALLWQARPGRPQAGVLGLAASGRHLPGRQQRSLQRHLAEGAVRVPQAVPLLVEHAPVVEGDHLTPVVDVADHPDRSAVADRVAGDRHLEGAEALAEGDLLLVADLLAAEDEDRVPVEGVAKEGEGAAVYGGGDVDAADLGSDVLREPVDSHARLQPRPVLAGTTSEPASCAHGRRSPPAGGTRRLRWRPSVRADRDRPNRPRAGAPSSGRQAGSPDR